MSRASQILQLRELIQRHGSAPVSHTRGYLKSGIEALDMLLEGGLWKGGIVELACEAKTSGASSLMRAILRQAATRGEWFALIDGSDCFDPQSAGADILANLLWIRCLTPTQAIHCVDLLLRDGNLPLVVLDLRGHGWADLRKIPDPTWYRLQRAIEPTSVAMLALTPRPLISSADVRITVESSFHLESLERGQEELLQELRLQVARKRTSAPLGTQPSMAKTG
jgi:hypothetical protein